MGGGKKKNENENENGRKREFATDPRSKRAREKNTPFGHAPHSDFWRPAIKAEPPNPNRISRPAKKTRTHLNHPPPPPSVAQPQS